VKLSTSGSPRRSPRTDDNSTAADHASVLYRAPDGARDGRAVQTPTPRSRTDEAGAITGTRDEEYDFAPLANSFGSRTPACSPDCIPLSRVPGLA
jgi:hypothetical protein